MPGQSNETEFLTAIKAIMKRDASVGELSCLRRLLHEAYSMSAAELKERGVKRVASRFHMVAER